MDYSRLDRLNHMRNGTWERSVLWSLLQTEKGQQVSKCSFIFSRTFNRIICRIHGQRTMITSIWGLGRSKTGNRRLQRLQLLRRQPCSISACKTRPYLPSRTDAICNRALVQRDIRVPSENASPPIYITKLINFTKSA